MSLMINIKKIHEKMTDKPVGQKLYHFFYGATGALTAEQIKEVKKIVSEEQNAVNKFLKKA